MDVSGKIEIAKMLVAIFGGVVAFLFGRFEYLKSVKVRRAEFLDKLAQEFNDPKMFLAKKILDDFWIEPNGDPNLSDEHLVYLGSREKIEKELLKEQVKSLLRHHSEEPVTGYGAHKARQSFDDLLDFFTKMQHYLDLKLVRKKDLRYFTYYLRKCVRKADGAVLKYAKHYEYPSISKLISNLGIS